MNLTGDYIKQKTRDNQQGKTSEENIAGAWRIKRKKYRNEHKRHKGYGESSNNKREE